MRAPAAASPRPGTDARRSRGEILRGIRVVHPFPSILDGVITFVIALVAGAPPARAAALGVAMIALQASIGALNDLVDAPRDAISNPRKPLPAGHVSAVVARVAALAGLVTGLGLSAAMGPGVLAIALVGVGIGFLYDLRLKGTALAWLPFAFGIPLLPVYAWYGAADAVPSGFVILVPAAIAAGAALALGNQLADFERDRTSGTGSTAARLGRDASWAAMALLQAGVVAVALGSLALLGGNGPGVAVAGMGAVVIGTGTLAARIGLGPIGARAWELQAIGVGLLAAGWVSSLAGTNALRT